MAKRSEIVFYVALASAFWVFLIAANSDPLAIYSICETDQFGKNSCTAQHLLYVVVRYLFNSNAITALATVATAYFTWTIKTINNKQLANTRPIERAYLSAGGVPEPGHAAHTTPSGQVVSVAILTGGFQLHVNNHGKTPGRLLHIAVEFCDAAAIPPLPTYRKIYNPDFIGPGTQSRIYGSHLVPQNLINPIVYGRLYYQDVFGSEIHSSGFIQTLDMTNGGTGLIEPPSADYTAWD